MASNDNPGAPFETVPPGEAGEINEIATLTAGLQHIRAETDKSKEGRLLRGVHPKSHGCVKAKFVVREDIKKEYQVGLFAHPGNAYEAWIRFSNGVDQVTPDSKEDLRGLGIKLFGVEGVKLLEAEKFTQDFLFIGHDAFFVKSVEQFADFFENAARGRNPLRFFLTHKRGLLNLIAGTRIYASNLEIHWFSVAPFLFGDRAVKYAIKPTRPSTKVPKNPGDDYLFDEMRTHLASEDDHLDFLIQFQLDPRRNPIENPLIQWREKQSPFIKVASIKIPAQKFDSPEQIQFSENMTFNPWHSLHEHRPLGGLNRGRKDVMMALQDFRLARNDVERIEPTGDERF